MATSRTGPDVLRASRQAPVPRLPQPTKPILMTSLPAAWAKRPTSRPAKTDPAATAVAESFSHARRESLPAIGLFSG